MRGNRKCRNHRRRIPAAAWAGFALAAVLLGFNGYSIAKYVFEQEKDVLYVAENFYFESDLLQTVSGGSYPSYQLQEGADQISFTLKNYPDELRVSEVDISYTVELSGANAETKTGTMSKDKKSDEIITFANLPAGTYVVTAKATAPYTETLKASFMLTDSSDAVTSSLNDVAGSPVLQFTVTTGNYEGNVTISWPAGVLPDNTDKWLRNASGNSCVVSFEKYSEYTFQFFKENPAGICSGFSAVAAN